MALAERVLDRYEYQELPALALRLRPCTLAGSRLAQLLTLPEKDSIKHLSLYAQEQRILEAAKAIRIQLVSLLLPTKRNGPMNLLQWLLCQLYSDGHATCRYFAVGDYVLQHIHPVGLAGVLLHLFQKQRERPIAEYVIGPLQCRDLTLLLDVIAPTCAAPEEVQGNASRYHPRRQGANRGVSLH
jgi:hypothetical protein